MLRLQSVGKKLGSFSMSELNLDVESGEYMVLLGPSGVGKTILIELIAGLIRPDSGMVFWQGRDITSYPPELRGFSVVYQDYSLFPHMTVYANLAYGLRAGNTKESVRSVAMRIGIEHLLDRHPQRLSGGEQQRVALARALITKPQLLLLDEPLSSLDANTRRQLRRELKQTQRETGTTFLHVTHDVEEAVVLGNRIGVMLEGKIRQVDTPQSLFRTPSDADVAQFLGMQNVFQVSEVHNGVCRVGGTNIFASALDDSTSHVWIKPEEVVLSTQPFESSARNQLKCVVQEWEQSGPLPAVRMACGELVLTALITYESFSELAVRPGIDIYATFKSSSVHCF